MVATPLPAAAVAAGVGVGIAVVAVAVAVAVVFGAAERAVAAAIFHAEERLGASTVASPPAYMLAGFADVEAVGVEHSMAVAGSAGPVNCR